MFDNDNAAAPAATEAADQAPAIITQIAEYSVTAAALGELRGKYERVLFPVTTTAGMKDAVAARAELRGLRISLEAKRKEIKGPALERCRLIDAEAKDITAVLVSLEDPINAQIQAEQARKEAEKAERERKEAERKAGIQTKIDTIRGIPLAMTGLAAAEFDAEIAELRAFVPGDEFAEFKDDATAAANAAIVVLLGMQEKQVAIEAEAARVEAERLAAIEAQRLAKIESGRIAAEQAAEAQRLADLRAELEAAAQRQRDADAEAARLAKVESDRVAAELKAKLDAQQAEIDAARKKQEDEAAAARQAQEAERAAFEAERKAFQDQQAAVAAQAEADRIAALPKPAADPEPVLQVQEVTAEAAHEIFTEAPETVEVEPQSQVIILPEVLDFEMAVSALLQTRTPIEIRAMLDLALIRFAEELGAA